MRASARLRPLDKPVAKLPFVLGAPVLYHGQQPDACLTKSRRSRRALLRATDLTLPARGVRLASTPAAFDGIGARDKDDGDRLGRCLSVRRGICGVCDNDRHLPANKVSCERWS